jgi:hypothetical protein
MYTSPNTIQVIKSRRMRWAGNLACRADRKVHRGFWWGDLIERNHLEDLGVDVRIILKWIFKTWNGRHGLD